MDLVEARMRAHGVEVRRGAPALTGDIAMAARVKEANSWGADLYYVAHTNAGGGRYSMTMCWGDAASLAMAEILHKHRKSVGSHKVVTRKDLYEIRATKMICLYDELFFHDNAEDCAWFHGGGMQQMAEETVAALCAMLGITYVPVPQEKTDRLYRVQVGAYVQKSNATAMVQRLKEAGFEAIIV
jgi:N-acetylmuramoyl-L-alanine amidase